MKWLSWLQYLVPRDEETEPGFKAEIDRLSLVGLRAIAIVCIGATAMMFLIGSILYHGDVKEWIFPLTDLTVMSIGVAALALSFSRRASGWARLLGALVGYVVATAHIACHSCWSWSSARAVRWRRPRSTSRCGGWSSARS